MLAMELEDGAYEMKDVDSFYDMKRAKKQVFQMQYY